jgi:polyisoprenoid-binding protein YceI
MLGLPMRTVAFALLLLAANAVAKPQNFRLDPIHTQITFFVSHLGFSQSSGRLHVLSGDFRFDPQDWTAAKVNAMVDIASLNMGDADCEKKLKSDEFFNVKKYPYAYFVSDSVEKINDTRGVVHGALSLHGVTRKLDVAFTVNKAGVHAYTFKYTMGLSAVMAIKRSDFGMRALLPGVGDEVEVRLEVEGQRERNAPETPIPKNDQEEPDGAEE